MIGALLASKYTSIFTDCFKGKTVPPYYRRKLTFSCHLMNTFNSKLNLNFDMATNRKQLPTEIWTHIISLVNSQATLAAICGVSRNLKDVAAPKLYKHIVLQIDERLVTLFDGLSHANEPYTMFRQQARTVKTIEFQTDWIAFGDNHGVWIILRVAKTLSETANLLEHLVCVKWGLPELDHFYDIPTQDILLFNAMWKALHQLPQWYVSCVLYIEKF